MHCTWEVRNICWSTPKFYLQIYFERGTRGSLPIRCGRPMSMLPNSSQEGAYRQTQTNTEYSIIYSLATREASKSITQLETTTTSRATSTRISVRFGPAGREPARRCRRRRRHPRRWTDSMYVPRCVVGWSVGRLLAPLLFGGILI